MNVESFFFPSIFGNLVATNFFFLPFSAMSLPQLVSISGRTRNSVISLPKFNFLSLLTHCTFSCNFGNTVAEIQSLSSFFQITLNSTYKNNKLPFLQFLAKRLPPPPPQIVFIKIISKYIGINFSNFFFL